MSLVVVIVLLLEGTLCKDVVERLQKSFANDLRAFHFER
jgi:hypothetical protein